MSSPQAPNSPARSQTSDSHANVRDAFAGLPALPALPVEGLGENPGVDNPLDWVPNSPAHLEKLDPQIGVFDAFAGLPELPIDNFGQFNNAGHHEQANDRDSHSIVRDAFATLPAVPNDNFGFDFGAVGPFNFDEHADFTGNHDNADFIPTDFELGLQRALASAQEHIGDFAPTFDEFNAHPPQVPDNSGPDGDFDPEQLLARFRSGALSPGQQAGAVDGMAEQNMDSVYRALMRENGFQPIQYASPVDAPVAKPTAMPSATPAAGPAAPPSNTLTEHNYVPIAWEPEYDEDEDPDTPMDPNTPVDPIIPVDPNAPPPPPPPQPIYPAFTAKFQTGPEARAYRKRNRVPRKSQAPDIERVKRYGRMYWVRRIYECMIDITNVSDSAGSIHRARFMVEPAFDPLDLEAAAHHVFDEALAVHERGWVRPIIYHKKVVRGKLTDVSEKCLERRLARICLCLQQKKATVDDALRGGVTLALLCDNPEARGFTKLSNNAGNAKRGERLRAAKLLVVEDSEDERQRP